GRRRAPCRQPGGRARRPDGCRGRRGGEAARARARGARAPRRPPLAAPTARSAALTSGSGGPGTRVPRSTTPRAASHTIEPVFDGVVLGIDPGLSRCGYGALRRDGHRMVAVAYGVLRTPADGALPQRLAQLQTDLEALLDDLAPAAVAV